MELASKIKIVKVSSICGVFTINGLNQSFDVNKKCNGRH